MFCGLKPEAVISARDNDRLPTEIFGLDRGQLRPLVLEEFGECKLHDCDSMKMGRYSAGKAILPVYKTLLRIVSFRDSHTAVIPSGHGLDKALDLARRKAARPFRMKSFRLVPCYILHCIFTGSPGA